MCERAPAKVLLEKKRKKLCLRASSSRSAAREEKKKKDKVRGRFWNLVESKEEKRKERMKISIRVWWRKIKRK